MHEAASHLCGIMQPLDAAEANWQNLLAPAQSTLSSQHRLTSYEAKEYQSDPV